MASPDGGGAGVLFWVTAVQAALVFLQAAFAGQFLDGNQTGLDLHQANAEVIPLLTIAQMVIAIRVWLRRRVAWPTAASSLLVVVVVVVQVRLGYSRQVAVHVPLGVAIFGTTLWLLLGARRWRETLPVRGESRSGRGDGWK